MVAGPAWIRRRDPGLLTVRRAVRVAVVACVGFYPCRYALHDGVLATYALFTAVALGFLAQIPGPAVRKATTLLVALPFTCVLVTIGSLIAGNVWVASAGMLVFGFLISYAGVGGPRLVGLTAGMQLLFILPGFPPYALGQLPSRLGGVALAVGLLMLAELLLWPDRAQVHLEDRLATAAEALGSLLADRALTRPATGRDGGGGWTFEAAERAAQAIRPSRLPPSARPAGAGRHDRALSHACALLRYALVRLGDLPTGPPPARAVGELLAQAGRGAAATAQALRGGPLPPTTHLAAAFAEVRREQGAWPAHPLPAGAYNTTLTLVIGDAVWAMATAVRVAKGGPVEAGHGSRKARRERFPYAYAGPLRLWWRRFVVHLTPRSVYFQQAVRVAAALAVARLVAGVLQLEHGFWVLLATLTLLRSRAADTRIALLPALIGTVAGAIAAGIVLYLIGNAIGVYAALLPPVLVLAFAAGALLGPTWGQAMFTVAVTFVFTQLGPASVTLAGVRLADVLVGAVIGVGAGVLAWPRGAAGELRRSTSNFLYAGGDLVRETAHELTTAPPAHGTGTGSRAETPTGAAARASNEPASVAAVEGGAPIDRVKHAMALADASYSMYQAERHSPAESKVDWQAVLVAGHHIVRGSELLRDSSVPGSMAPWRDLVEESAARVEAEGDRLADAIRRGDDPRAEPVDVVAAPDLRVLDVQLWLSGVRDDLDRVGRAPSDLSAP